MQGIALYCNNYDTVFTHVVTYCISYGLSEGACIDKRGIKDVYLMYSPEYRTKGVNKKGKIYDTLQLFKNCHL